MRLTILLMKQVKFWLLLVPFIVLFVSLVEHLFFATPFAIWKNLPPLPNGETAREFTDVLAGNRINVITDQGHYFNCSYQDPETCWISIPREVNHPKSTNPGIDLPLPPLGTRQMVSNFHSVSVDCSAGWLVLATVIRGNGQVAFWQTSVRNPALHYHNICGSMCGVLFIINVILMVSVVHATLRKLSATQDPGSSLQ